MTGITTRRFARRHWMTFWVVAGLSGVLAAGLTVAARTVPEAMLAMRDVAAVARDGLPLPFFVGWISNVGVLGWFGSAAALLVSAWVSLRWGSRRTAAFTGAAGGISLLLGVDDLFMLHDGAIGTGEEVLLLVWLLLALGWVTAFRRELLADPKLPVLVLAAAFMGHSVLADLAVNGALLLHEDASKLAGILVWTVWAWATALRAIHGTVHAHVLRRDEAELLAARPS